MFFGHSVQASNPIVDGSPQEFWFTFDTAQTLTVRTYQLDGWFSDPMLWLYDSDEHLLASNDDWYGLQSNIAFQVQPGSYRVRAGWCCGNPDAVRQGWRYSFGSSADPVSTTTSTVQESTTVEETTSSWTTSTTMLESTTVSSITIHETTIPYVAPTTTDPAPTTSVQPATSQPTTTLPEPTTTTDASTTTLAVSETITTVPVSEKIQTTSTVQEATTTSNVDTTSVPRPVTRTTAELPPLKPVATTSTQTFATSPIISPEPTTSEPAPTTTTEPLQTPEPVLTPDAVTTAIDQADTPAEKAALVTQLNTANNETKKVFEATVNVYDGQWDSYVPAGSRIPVGERRTLIAVMGGLVSLASTAPRRKK